jgi:hypothetical protein
VNEAPELTDVSLNSDEDDEDIDSIVKAYRHAHARPPPSLVPGAALLLPSLVLLSSGLGGLASWLAISSEAAGRPLVGLVAPSAGLVLVGCSAALAAPVWGEAAEASAGPLAANLAALLLLSFHVAPFVMAVQYGLVGLGLWLGVGLLVYQVYGAAVSNSKKTVKNVLVVSTIS